MGHPVYSEVPVQESVTVILYKIVSSSLPQRPNDDFNDPFRVRGNALVPRARDSTWLEKLHEGRGFVEPGVHPGRDSHRVAAVSG